MVYLYLKIFGWAKMMADGHRWGRCWKVVLDGRRWWQMYIDGLRWWKMVEDGPRWGMMAKEGGRWT